MPNAGVVTLNRGVATVVVSRKPGAHATQPISVVAAPVAATVAATATATAATAALGVAPAPAKPLSAQRRAAVEPRNSGVTR
eukprot:6212141-Pleurochrysis_carterae.AAC.5